MFVALMAAHSIWFWVFFVPFLLDIVEWVGGINERR